MASLGTLAFFVPVKWYKVMLQIIGESSGAEKLKSLGGRTVQWNLITFCSDWVIVDGETGCIVTALKEESEWWIVLKTFKKPFSLSPVFHVGSLAVCATSARTWENASPNWLIRASHREDDSNSKEIIVFYLKCFWRLTFAELSQCSYQNITVPLPIYHSSVLSLLFSFHGDKE